ncbi:hypothetical protein ACFX2G_016062 [Malus domestica]
MSAPSRSLTAEIRETAEEQRNWRRREEAEEERKMNEWEAEGVEAAASRKVEASLWVLWCIHSFEERNMGRGVSSGGGESSLGYLFGGGEETQNPVAKRGAAPQNQAPVPTAEPPAQRATAPAPPAEVNKEIPAGVPGNTSNNYFRADGQNCGNFITDRPSTKVHSAPGGGSSLDYLFGGGGGGGGK